MRFGNIYEAMEISKGENILSRKELANNGNQVPTKEKKAQIYQMKSICLLLNDYQNIHSLLLNQIKDGCNVVRDEYPVTTTSSLDILMHTEGGICGN